jgi:hypothetical protein
VSRRHRPPHVRMPRPKQISCGEEPISPSRKCVQTQPEVRADSSAQEPRHQNGAQGSRSWDGIDHGASEHDEIQWHRQIHRKSCRLHFDPHRLRLDDCDSCISQQDHHDESAGQTSEPHDERSISDSHIGSFLSNSCQEQRNISRPLSFGSFRRVTRARAIRDSLKRFRSRLGSKSIKLSNAPFI